jgi:creatinine amidohydrolase
MQLWLQTWSEIETYLKRSQGIIVPIGSTEQHGPNGLIGTDAICADTIARGVGEAAGALVAPVISVGIAGHHMTFAGTMKIAPSTLIGLMRDYVTSLAHHGFTRFFFLNGHGGNIATVKAGFAEIFNERYLAGLPEVRCTLVNWWDCPGVEKLYTEFYGAAEGQHATASEVSVTQFVYPDHIKRVPLDPPVAPDSPHFYDARDFRRRFPDGRMGSNPGLSTPEHGKLFYEESVKGMTALYKQFLEEG